MENTDNVTEVKAEIIPSSELSTVLKAEIDMQITTAKAYPRDIKKFMAKTESIATVTQEVAESCVYALPRKKKDDKTGKWETIFIQGPSIRLAEIVCSCFGNIRSGARVISNDGKTIVAQGSCHDLETNNFITIEVRRKITNKLGQTYTEDMQVMAGNAACAIAFRNAVFKVVPAALIEGVYDKVLEVSKGTAETLIARRTKALSWFKSKGVTEEQIFEALKVSNEEAIDLDKLAILSGYKSSINNGEASIEELFQGKEDKGKEKSAKSTEETINMMDSKKK